MLQGLNSAAAGMAAQRQRLDAVANDLANANTAGYKHVRVGFRDLLYQDAGRSSAPGIGTGSGAAVVQAGRSFAQGTLSTTGNQLDVGIQGEGFLRIRLPDGSDGLTRQGSLQVDGAGRLATATGRLLQPAVAIPAGTPASQIAIAPDGRVLAAGREVGRIALVDVRSPQNLRSVGDNAFAVTAESGPARPAGPGTTLSQGTIEASNVDVAEAMVGMIESQRAFQLASKAISTADQMMEIANGVRR